MNGKMRSNIQLWCICFGLPAMVVGLAIGNMPMLIAGALVLLAAVCLIRD